MSDCFWRSPNFVGYFASSEEHSNENNCLNWRNGRWVEDSFPIMLATSS